mmetsp:Transcript_12228/g.24398  ORF Transcript_12228/g.24398 Transcript_12228/m.24398 type:complete len:549 (-) Transcript_12228:284-1930(-)
MPFLLSRRRRRPGVASALLLSCASYAAAKVRPTINSLSQIPFNADGRLSQHLLLYPAGDCASRIESQLNWDPHNRLVHSVEGEALELFFPDLADGGCSAVCVRLGTARDLAHALMPHHRYYPDSQPNFRENFFSPYCEKVESGFMQYYTERYGHLDFYWISHTGERVYQGEIKYGETNTKYINSYLGHTFHLVDPTTDEVVREHTVEFDHIAVAGKPPSLVEENPRSRAREILSTHESEWIRHGKIKRTFSPLGFTKGRLPDDMFASMGSFYYNNAKFAIPEESAPNYDKVFINWWESPVHFVQIPWGLRSKWQDRLRLLVETWTNVALENTDMYGMRQYEDGARLLTHVDRESTHAASLIVNVAQGNDLTRPWTVEVHDHADRLHEVVMSPGDVVYYESAACLHARNTPLAGGKYVNLFAHYRPVGDPDWYKKPNPPGTPEKLMDVGNCWLEGEADAMSQGAVVCDDPRVGPHLSPTMFAPKSGDDLFKWWEAVSEGPPMRKVENVAQVEAEMCRDCERPVGENSSHVPVNRIPTPPKATPLTYDEL